MSRLPEYYSQLAPFRAAFEQGNPILTYHKIGPTPARPRMKGLYLSASLFRRQLEELRAAGFMNGSLEASAGPREGRKIVITFDDGYVNVLEHTLEPLAEAGLKAVQFLVAGLLGRCNEWDMTLGEVPEPMMDLEQIHDWLAAGHDIGSHTLTHPHLTALPLDRAKEEIVASKKQLEDFFARPVQHFCYPYGDWNENLRDMVQEAGYVTACTTDVGVNDAQTSPFLLKRVTARYQTRRLKNMFQWFRRSRKPSAQPAL